MALQVLPVEASCQVVIASLKALEFCDPTAVFPEGRQCAGFGSHHHQQHAASRADLVIERRPAPLIALVSERRCLRNRWNQAI